MITFGPTKLILDNYINSNIVYNLSSMIEYGEMLNTLYPAFPNVNVGSLILNDEPTFDSMYFDYLMGPAFHDFMKIFLHDYFGSNVYICITTEGENFVEDAVLQSLIKFAQLRYGIILNVIYSLEDADYRRDTEYSAIGIQNFHADKERFFAIFGGDEFEQYESSH